MNYVSFIEDKYGAIVEESQEYESCVVANVRIVKHDFEYTCKIVLDKNTMTVTDYSVMYIWHVPKKEQIPISKKQMETPVAKKRTVLRQSVGMRTLVTA